MVSRRITRLSMALCVAGITVFSSIAAADKTRPGPVAVLAVEGPAGILLPYLRSGDFDFEPMGGGMARVYADLEELARLKFQGFRLEILEWQPNPPQFSSDAKTLGTYHSYDAVTTMLTGFADSYPGICRLHNLGSSVQGRSIWALKITDNPDVDEEEPEFKYVSTIHGDEPLGTEMCLYFIDLLLRSYGGSSAQATRITWLIDNTAIWIVPLMNPDGLMLGTRYNAQGIDLNRRFPSFVQDGASGTVYDGAPLNETGRPIEVQHIMRWTAGNSFVLSANFHTGAMLVNYPYDEDTGTPHIYKACPDDDLFIYISKQYSSSNIPMYTNPSFLYGISNGSAWYTIYGGMQDWNYRYAACNEVTIELSNTKKPAESTLPTQWANNRESMLRYLECVHMGIRGTVRDAVTAAPVYAKILVQGRDQPVFSDPDVGDYYRMLLPGRHALTVVADGYHMRTVPSTLVSAGAVARVNIQLMPVSAGTESRHTADVDADFRVSLSELLRVVQFFNARAYHCDASTEDGYAVGTGSQSGCAPHHSDYVPQDWSISLSEVLRLVQLYNNGGYIPCETGEDGFCLGLS